MKYALSFLLLSMPALAQAGPVTSYIRDNLSSDIPGFAKQTDERLVNPSGLTVSPQGPFWIAKKGSGTASSCDSTGALYPSTRAPSVVKLPEGPMGIAYNSTASFVISKDRHEAPAALLVASENGTVSAWNSEVDPANAIVVIDHSLDGAVYKGLALASDSLYVTNFYTGLVEKYDSRFKYVGSFADPGIPEGYAPFGIANVRDNLVVTYAKQDDLRRGDVAGAGNGYVDIFKPDGTLVSRLASGGDLNSPYGLALHDDLLYVGNSGDGHINVFDFPSGKSEGQLRDIRGETLVIDGLRALSFGNGYEGGQVNYLYFTAAVQGNSHGVFGQLRPFKYHPLLER